MKKLISSALSLLLAAGLLTGCSFEDAASDLYDLVSGDLVEVEYDSSVPSDPDETEEVAATASIEDALSDIDAYFNSTEESTMPTRAPSKTQPATETQTTAESLDTEPATEAVSDDYTEAEGFDTQLTITEDGMYSSKDEVALYIHLYHHLPDNYITKKEAQALGWPGGSLEPYAPGKCIGGSNFGNYEEQLPEAAGRKYKECDIDTLGAKSRGAKRIVYSNDGLIYYTEDHYETFELLYGEETP